MTKEQFKKLIQDVYNNIDNRKHDQSYFIKYDGSKESTDVGYAFDGIDLFKEELEVALDKFEDTKDKIPEDDLIQLDNYYKSISSILTGVDKLIKNVIKESYNDGYNRGKNESNDNGR